MTEPSVQKPPLSLTPSRHPSPLPFRNLRQPNLRHPLRLMRSRRRCLPRPLDLRRTTRAILRGSFRRRSRNHRRPTQRLLQRTTNPTLKRNLTPLSVDPGRELSRKSWPTPVVLQRTHGSSTPRNARRTTQTSHIARLEGGRRTSRRNRAFSTTSPLTTLRTTPRYNATFTGSRFTKTGRFAPTELLTLSLNGLALNSISMEPKVPKAPDAIGAKGTNRQRPEHPQDPYESF
jgi:hypothetical protein